MSLHLTARRRGTSSLNTCSLVNPLSGKTRHEVAGCRCFHGPLGVFPLAATLCTRQGEGTPAPEKTLRPSRKGKRAGPTAPISFQGRVARRHPLHAKPSHVTGVVEPLAPGKKSAQWARLFFLCGKAEVSFQALACPRPGACRESPPEEIHREDHENTYNQPPHAVFSLRAG